MNVDDNGQLNVNVNSLENDNVWNAKYRNRIVVPKLSMFLLDPRRGVFLFKTFLPPAEHPTDFIQLSGKFNIFFILNTFVFPSNLEKKFHTVQFGN